MPGTILDAVPTGLFPISLSKKFAESHAVLARISEYHDGSSQRQSLVSEVRRTWKLAKRLTASELTTLRDHWKANRQNAFSFYNPFETSPLFASAPTGSVGLYTVRYASDWDETVGIVRSDAQVELIELGSDAFVPTPAPPPPPSPVDYTRVVLTTTTAYTTDPILTPGAKISIYGYSFAFGHTAVLQGNGSWAKRSDSFDVTSTLLDVQLTQAAGITALSVYFFIDNFISGTGVALFDVYDAFLTATLPDGTTQVFRPSTTSFVPNSGSGVMVDNADPTLSPQDAFAVDGNTTTFAELKGTAWASLNIPPLFVLSTFV